MVEKCFLHLLKNKQTLFTAESCTAGLICSSFGEIPGVSSVLLGGVVCYDNLIKQNVLGVLPSTIEEHGAVSFACCREMLIGAQKISQADFVCGTTGIAGPDGGTAEKPVGTVFIGVLGKDGGLMIRLKLDGTRQEIREQAAEATANLVWAWAAEKDFEHLSMEDIKEIEPQ
ncbi:MAG: CinA family protein [Brevinema sp.]